MLLAIHRFCLIRHIVIGSRNQIQIGRYRRRGKNNIQRNPTTLKSIEGLCRHHRHRLLLGLQIKCISILYLFADTEVQISSSAIIPAMSRQHIPRRFNGTGHLSRDLLQQIIIQTVSGNGHLDPIQVHLYIIIVRILNEQVAFSHILRPIKRPAYPDIAILPSHRGMRIFRCSESGLAGFPSLRDIPTLPPCAFRLSKGIGSLP